MPDTPRLLLIDDEPALADFMAAAARMTGFEPSIASDQAGFKKAFGEERPQVIVLDLGMPNTDGVEFLRYLGTERFSGPVLIVSGFDRRVLESAFRLGTEFGLKMVGPLEKPVRLEELETLLSSLHSTVEP